MFIESILLKNLNVIHGFFTRKGGYSSGAYNSLNCKFHFGDLKKNVEKNLITVANCFNFDITDITLPKQIHSNIVVKGDNSLDKLKGDAVFTNKEKSLIAITTADCVPILIWDDKNKICMAIHAGWKGAYSGIIENSIDKIKKFGQNKIYATIGPCIRQKNYEIDKNFYQLFIKQQLRNKNYFISSTNQNKFLFDLPRYCYDKLIECGVQKIEDLGIDTYSNKESFFSYRRAVHKNNKNFGCQISVIGLK